LAAFGVSDADARLQLELFDADVIRRRRGFHNRSTCMRWRFRNRAQKAKGRHLASAGLLEKP
jgi:hypothetical protein